MEQHMWRRYGDALYTLLTLAIFGFETIALGALSLAFLLGAAAGIASTPIEEILLAVVTSTASALALLGLYLLSYHFISSTRDLSPRFALLFVLLAVMYGMLSSQLAAGIETFLSTRYPRLRDRAILFLAAFLEFVGYRQFLALERTVATVQVPFKKGQWGKMHRTGIKDSSQTPPAEERTPAGV